MWLENIPVKYPNLSLVPVFKIRFEHAFILAELEEIIKASNNCVFYPFLGAISADLRFCLKCSKKRMQTLEGVPDLYGCLLVVVALIVWAVLLRILRWKTQSKIFLIFVILQTLVIHPCSMTVLMAKHMVPLNKWVFVANIIP